MSSAADRLLEVETTNEGGAGDACSEGQNSHELFSCQGNRSLQPHDVVLSEKCTKKRKLDKDGFTTPSSPIHSTTTITASSVNIENGVAAGDCKPETSSSNLEKTIESAVLKSCGDTVKEAGHDFSTLINQWAQNFQDSEDFETFSISRLDRMLKKALAYEAHLKTEKSKLAVRLTQLAKTLQED